jgi:hypothetical protein
VWRRGSGCILRCWLLGTDVSDTRTVGKMKRTLQVVIAVQQTLGDCCNLTKGIFRGHVFSEYCTCTNQEGRIDCLEITGGRRSSRI